MKINIATYPKVKTLVYCFFSTAPTGEQSYKIKWDWMIFIRCFWGLLGVSEVLFPAIARFRELSPIILKKCISIYDLPSIRSSSHCSSLRQWAQKQNISWKFCNKVYRRQENFQQILNYLYSYVNKVFFFNCILDRSKYVAIDFSI